MSQYSEARPVHQGPGKYELQGDGRFYQDQGPAPAGYHRSQDGPENEMEVPNALKPQSVFRDFLCEFMGTLTLNLVGIGAIAQTVLSGGKNGNWNTLVLGWAIGIFLGAIVCGKSGGHMNPAVTVAMAIYRRFPVWKIPVYFIAQFLGAFIAAAFVWGNYHLSIYNFEGNTGRLSVPPSSRATAGIFATYPAPYLNKAAQFFSEILGTGLLVFFVFAITDDHNPLWLGKFVPFGLFLIIYVIGVAFGSETGFALNPARDFAPRVLTAMVGYGKDIWTAGNNYFVVPLFAPIIGAIFGGFIYDLFLYTADASPLHSFLSARFGRFFPRSSGPPGEFVTTAANV